MPRGQSKNDPVVDVLKVWREGHEPVPTLAEQLAEELPPTVRHDQRVIPAEDVQFYFPQADADPEDSAPEPDSAGPSELAAALEVLPEDPAPVGREPVVLDGLEQFKPEDPTEAVVLPLEVADAPDSKLAGIIKEAFEQELPAAIQVCSGSHESPAGAKFCMECGQAFTVEAQPPPSRDWTCNLGHLIDAAAKFCMECGDQRPDLKAPVSGAGLAAEMQARVTPAELLSPEQRAERERQHAGALRAGAENPQPVIERPSGQRPTITFHIVKSGWTWAGLVWYRGQEITLEEGTPRWHEAQRFINWSEQEQMDRYGCIRWRLGPWPFRKSYVDGAGAVQKLATLDGKGQVAGPTEDQLRQADELERRRGGGVPRPMYG